jgi:hypothetical protein
VEVAATVDVDGGAGEVRGIVGGEERDDARYLFDCRGAPERYGCRDWGLLLVGGADSDIGIDSPWCDGVDGHSAVLKLARKCFS